MKLIIVVALALVACACANEEPIKTIRSESNQDPEGGYRFGFETENGINWDQTGELKEGLDEENKPHKFLAVRGSYTYTDPEGNPETVNYFADETGYHAEGPSIPKTVSRR